MAGIGQGDGWLDRLDKDVRAQAAARLPSWLPEIVAALCWLVIRPGPDLRARTINFQPVLTAALSSGLVEPTDTTAAYLSIVTGQPITRGQADEQLLEAIDNIDDDLWCAGTTAGLDLDKLQLRAPPGAAAVSVRLDVGGITDQLADPRVPRLLATVRHYRRSDGVALFAADDSWRLSFESGRTIAYLLAAAATPSSPRSCLTVTCSKNSLHPRVSWPTSSRPASTPHDDAARTLRTSALTPEPEPGRAGTASAPSRAPRGRLADPRFRLGLRLVSS